MNLFVPLTLFGWIPLVLAVFCFCRPRTAVLFSLFGAWLFLPMAGFSFAGLPDYGKITAGPVAALLGVLIFDAGRLSQLRLSVWDAPMAVVLLSPFVSSVVNGLGVYDGLSSVFNIVTTFGIAYLLGRLYFNDAEGRRALARAFFIAGLIYIPLCLYEIRLSPQLHKMVYGFAQHNFSQTYRMGGWRPMVFMQHGLAVGLFMAAASAVGVWLWLTRQQRSVAGVPMALCVITLLATAVLCKSAFALVLLLAVLPALLLVRFTGWRVPVLFLALLPPLYMAGRITGAIDGKQVLTLVEPAAGERIGSLGARIQSEEVLVPLAMRHPVWGVSRWARLIEDSRGERIDKTDYGVEVIPDALWVITLASRGLVGLTALSLVFFIPVLAAVRKPAGAASRAAHSFDPAIGLALVLIMHMADNLLNAMVSPVFWMIAGSLIGMLAVRRPARQAARPATQLVTAPRPWNQPCR